jgi:(p)ppGpp synthase/HD superfamily hydrolase
MTTNVRDLIRSLPLKEMDGTLLAAEIRERSRTLWPVSQFKDYDVNTVDYAIDFAAYFHREQRRRNRGDLPKDPYINHPLRNALRLLRYGVTDIGVVIAAILHDTLEDCKAEMAKANGYPETGDPHGIPTYDYAYDLIERSFGVDVAMLVESVTNPTWTSGSTKAQKRAEYIKNVTKEIKDPRVWLIKFADWVDNAAGLYHNVGGKEMVEHLTAKYLPLADIFLREFDSHVHALITPDGFEAIQKHIEQGRASLTKLAEEA